MEWGAVGNESRSWLIKSDFQSFSRLDTSIDSCSTSNEFVIDSIAGLAGFKSEALVKRCFAEDMITRSTPKDDSAFRGSSGTSW